MSYDNIIFEKDQNIAILTLNRPERLNAWTVQMDEEIIAAITDANNDPEIGAIVVTGAGRGFCAGADIRDSFNAKIERGEDRDAAKPSKKYVDFIRQSKPLIAAVNGVAVGVGVTQILPFDVILASEKARFGFAFVKMGVVPERASSHFLVQRVGFGHASEMCLSGRLYSAQEVHEKGLTNYVVSADLLMDEAMSIARVIAANPARQLRMVKSLLSANGSECDLSLVQNREAEAIAECYVSAEHKEAVKAFIEKREPNFKNL